MVIRLWCSWMGFCLTPKILEKEIMYFLCFLMLSCVNKKIEECTYFCYLYIRRFPIVDGCRYNIMLEVLFSTQKSNDDVCARCSIYNSISYIIRTTSLCHWTGYHLYNYFSCIILRPDVNWLINDDELDLLCKCTWWNCLIDATHATLCVILSNV